MKLTFHRAGLVTALLFIVTAGQAWAALPPEAQEAINKGMIAAKEQEWLIAIQSFQEARKLAPDAPEVFYNLGLAESKIPGRELRAIAWFGAYLAATPNAPNAAAVKEFIAILEIKSEGNTRRLLQSAEDNAGYQTGIGIQGPTTISNLKTIAYLLAAIGDVPAAMKAAALLDEGGVPDEINEKYSAMAQVASGQASAGDIAGALRTADQIKGPYTKAEALGNIVKAQATSGDIAGAEKTADLIQAGISKDRVNTWIARAQAAAGDIVAALKLADGMLDAYNRLLVQRDIAEAQLCAGDTAGALKTADIIQNPSTIKEALLKVLYEEQKHHTGVKPDFCPHAIVAADWLARLDDAQPTHSVALNTDPFLDLSGYLKSIPAQTTDGLGSAFHYLVPAAQTIAWAQIQIEQMLRQQLKGKGTT